MTKPVANSTIIAAFFWPHSRMQIAWMLGANAQKIRRIWRLAKVRRDLPRIARPRFGFDLRQEFWRAA